MWTNQSAHPNTREVIIKSITQYSLSEAINLLLCTFKAVQDDIMNCIKKQTKQIMWLNGAAGAGKSAIGRSIVERCISLGIPITRLFFFRTDPTRNNFEALGGDSRVSIDRDDTRNCSQ